MADNHTRLEEIDIDDDEEVTGQDLVIKDYESYEIALDEFDWDDISDLIPNDTILNFVPEDTAPETTGEEENPGKGRKIDSTTNDTTDVEQQEDPLDEIQPKFLVCAHCGKKYLKRFWYLKHIDTCGPGKAQKNPSKHKKKQTNLTNGTVSKTTNEAPTTSKESSAKTEPMKKREWLLSEDDIDKSYKDIVKTALNESVADKVNNLQVEGCITLGNKVVTLGKMLLKKTELETFKTDASMLVLIIFNKLNKDDLLDDTFLKSFWTDFHQEIINEEGMKPWRDFINDVKTPEYSSLYTAPCMSITRQIIALEREKLPSSNTPTPVEKMPERQQDVLRYVSGYVVYSLQKHYKRLKKSRVPSTRTAAHAASDFLTTLDTRFEKDLEARTYFDYTKQWTEIRNRGGLVQINDNTFIFMRRLEHEVRNVLTLELLKNYRGEDIREVINRKLSESTIVRSGWNILGRKLGNEHLSQVLKKAFIDKWVDIRAHAYVKCYMQLMSRISKEQKVSKKAEPALRHTLS